MDFTTKELKIMFDNFEHNTNDKFEEMRRRDEERHAEYRKGDEERTKMLLSIIEEQRKNAVKLDEIVIWKNEVTPSIDTMKQIKNFNVGSSWIIKSIIALGSAIVVIYAGLEFIKSYLRK